MKKILATMAATAVLSGGAGVALATTAYTRPPTPWWMDRPCTTDTTFYNTNCFWNGDQMGDGPADGIENHFVHTFAVQDDTGKQTNIRCYFYSKPTDTGNTVDHCVSTGAYEHGVAGWVDPTAKRRR